VQNKQSSGVPVVVNNSRKQLMFQRSAKCPYGNDKLTVMPANCTM